MAGVEFIYDEEVLGDSSSSDESEPEEMPPPPKRVSAAGTVKRLDREQEQRNERFRTLEDRKEQFASGKLRKDARLMLVLDSHSFSAAHANLMQGLQKHRVRAHRTAAARLLSWLPLPVTKRR